MSNADKLAATILDAARRIASNRVRAASAGCDSITGKRHSDTANRQHDRLHKAVAELVAIAKAKEVA